MTKLPKKAKILGPGGGCNDLLAFCNVLSCIWCSWGLGLRGRRGQGAPELGSCTTLVQADCRFGLREKEGEEGALLL